MDDAPKSIFDLLDLKQFREKTPMYLGQYSITLLRSFIAGYLHAVETNDIKLEDPVKFSEFHDWVADHFGWFESTAGWNNIILQECDGDERIALQTFFELYDLFKVRKLSKSRDAVEFLRETRDMNELPDILTDNIRNEKGVTVTIFCEIPGTSISIHQSSTMIIYAIGPKAPGYTIHISANNKSKKGRKINEALSQSYILSEFKKYSDKISNVYIKDFNTDIDSIVNKAHQIVDELKSFSSRKEPRLIVKIVKETHTLQ